VLTLCFECWHHWGTTASHSHARGHVRGTKWSFYWQWMEKMQLRVPILSMISTLNRISTLNTKGLVSKNVLPDKLYQLGEVEHDHRNGITFTSIIIIFLGSSAQILHIFKKQIHLNNESISHQLIRSSTRCCRHHHPKDRILKILYFCKIWTICFPLLTRSRSRTGEKWVSSDLAGSGTRWNWWKFGAFGWRTSQIWTNS
jgi:hypothetical protein